MIPQDMVAVGHILFFNDDRLSFLDSNVILFKKQLTKREILKSSFTKEKEKVFRACFIMFSHSSFLEI